MTILHSQLQIIRMHSLRSSLFYWNLLLFAYRVFSWNRLRKNIRIVLRSSKAVIDHDHLSSRHNMGCLYKWVCLNARVNHSWARSLFEFIVNFVDFCGGLIFCFTFLSLLLYAVWFSRFWGRRLSFWVFRGIMERKRIFPWFIIWIVISLRLDCLLLLSWYIRLWTYSHV